MENDNVATCCSLQNTEHRGTAEILTKLQKMKKEAMENNNVVMCHFLQKKQKENIEEIGTIFISTHLC